VTTAIGAKRGQADAAWLPSRDLFFTLVERKLRLQSKRSWVGVLWPIVAPVFLFVLYVFVFHHVLRVRALDYPVYLFAGLLPWTFLAQTLPESILSISSDAELVRRSRFRYELLPLATVTALSLHFLVTLIGFIVVLAAVGDLNAVLLPTLAVPVITLYLLVATIAMVLALIDVYNRDLRRVLANLLTIWFFLIPIVYLQSQATELHFLRYMDPANILISEFRSILVYGTYPPVHTIVSGLAICLGLFALAIYIHHRFRDRLAREV
jgi:ABC-type polysaccharide/polyol phosphate export permease